jgi:methionyl-tRNA synthetase
VAQDCVLTNTYFGYCLYCSEAAAKLIGEERGCLETGSNTVVVALFGKDNAGVGLIAPYAIGLSSERYRPFDQVIVNHLLHFEGSKCSTSRRHGIWVSELIENTSVSGDELRYYLAQAPLEAESTSVSMMELLSEINKLRVWQAGELSVACAKVSSESDANVSDHARKAIERQTLELQPNRLRMMPATAVLTHWMFDHTFDLSKPRQARSWLEGFALLAEPIMPSLAVQVWMYLGLPGRPVIEYLGSSAPVHEWTFSRFEPLSEAEIKPYAHISKEVV